MLVGSVFRDPWLGWHGRMGTTVAVLRVYLSACEVRLKVLVSGDLFRVLSTNSKQAFWADLMVGR